MHAVWLCLRFPLLALDALLAPQCDNNTASDTLAIAVKDKERIYCANRAAHALGIRNKQKVATASLLAPQLRLLTRQPDKEEEKRQSLALRLYDFSSQIVLPEPQSSALGQTCIYLEIARSQRLFGGLKPLLLNLQTQLQSITRQLDMGLGPSQQSAQLLSFQPLTASLDCWDESRHCWQEQAWLSLMSRCSIAQMDLSEKLKQQIKSVGLQTLGDLLKLPQSSLRKRFGQAFFHYWQRLFSPLDIEGRLFEPPQEFKQEFAFLEPLVHVQGLRFPMAHLLSELAHFLRLRQYQCQHIEWHLLDNNQHLHRLRVSHQAGYFDPKQMLELSLLRLERQQLAAEICSLSLQAKQLSAIEAQSNDLLSSHETFHDNLQFIDRLRARYGDDSCQWLQIHTSWLPEQQQSLSRQRQTRSAETTRYSSLPSWLLNKPRPLSSHSGKPYLDGEIQLLSNAEKIDANWWQQPICRSYYIGQNRHGQLLWLFWEHQQQRWYLHGYF